MTMARKPKVDPPLSRVTDFRFGWARRTPLIMQSEMSECGLACIAMILGYFGSEVSVSALRKRANFSGDGMNIGHLIEIADQVGLHGRPIRLDIDEIQKLRLPAIVHLDGNHFAILEGVRSGRYTLLDPAHGRRRVRASEFSDRFTGVALELTRAEQYATIKEKDPVRLSKLIGPVNGLYKALGTIFLFSLALELSVLLSPLFMQAVIDRVLVNSDAALLIGMAVGYGALVAAQATVSSLRAWAISTVGHGLRLGWYVNIFRHLMRLPEAYFSKRSVGDISSRFGGIDLLQQLLAVRVIEAVIDGVMIIATAAMIYTYNATLATIAVCGIALYFSIKAFAYQSMRESNIDQITAQAKQDTMFVESLRIVSCLRVHNMTATQISRFSGRVNHTIEKSLQLESLSLFYGAAGTIVSGAIKIATIYIGATLTMSGGFTAGMLVAFLAFSDQFVGRSSSLIDFFFSFRLMRTHAERLADITQSQVEKNYQSEVDIRLSETPSICLDAVSFRYSEDAGWILRNASLIARYGESIAITGVSGGGKTTVAKLLAGLIDPVAGCVKLDDQDVVLVGKRRLRDVVACVMQDDVLMSGSILQNISLHAPDPDEDFVETCAQIAGIHADIMRMPMRYETLVGDMGASLSGGQKQRICIARALYRRPKILIMDEATSHLDMDSEKEVSSLIRRLDITRIIIAHRPETIRSADRVLILENGSFREIDMEAGTTLQSRFVGQHTIEGKFNTSGVIR